MVWWVTALWWIASVAVSQLLAPKQEVDNAKASDKLRYPTSGEGRPIPVLFGTALLEAPAVAWNGDVATTPIRKRAGKHPLSGRTQWATVGYKYSTGLHLVLCHGVVDELKEIRFDRRIVWSGSRTAEGSFVIDAQEIFGGEDREGGVAANVAFYPGTTTQGTDSYLTTVLGAQPAYRGLCHLVWRGPQSGLIGAVPSGFAGNSEYIKAPSFLAKRCPHALKDAFGGSHATDIAGGANASEILFELLTNPEWGMGHDVATVDSTTFLAVASTVTTEGLGLNFVWDQATPAEDLAAEVARYCDLALTLDPTTGKWALRAIRPDYVKADLPVLSKSNCELISLSRPTPEELVNQLSVQWTDPASGYVKRLVTVQDLAGIQEAGGQAIPQQILYPAITSATLAPELAQRDLAVLGSPLAKVQLRMLPGAAWGLRVGDVRRFVWEATGEDLVIRIDRIRRGGPANAEIHVDALEDVFSLRSSAYGVLTSGWTDPVTGPAAPAAQALWEAPYHLVGTERQAIALVARGDGLSTACDTQVNLSGSYLPGATLDFLPSATLASPLSAATSGAVDEVSLALAGPIDLHLLRGTDFVGLWQGLNLALLGTEIIGWRDCASTSITGIIRGLFDTFPVDHPAGERIWFLTYPNLLGDEGWGAADLTVQAKLLPRGPRGRLSPAGATVLQLTTTSRSQRPYPPGRFQLDGYPLTSNQIITGTSGHTVTWAHRNRQAQALQARVVGQDGASDPVGAEGTYRLRVLQGIPDCIPTQFGAPLALSGSGASGGLATVPGCLTLNASGLRWSQAADLTVNLLANGTVCWAIDPTGTLQVVASPWTPGSPPAGWIPLWRYTATSGNYTITDERPNVVVYDQSGLTSASLALTLAQLLAGNQLSSIPLRFEIRQTAGGLDSVIRTSVPTWLAGWGLNYGNVYGGS